jgi:hypothetical protein
MTGLQIAAAIAAASVAGCVAVGLMGLVASDVVQDQRESAPRGRQFWFSNLLIAAGAGVLIIAAVLQVLG